ncbi:MAG TPA: hypothetical protein VMU50_16825 [Polyangia bacterium]|nr:hypothetical protein [Polyangia bacterium]
MNVQVRTVTLATMTLSMALFLGVGCASDDATDEDLAQTQTALAATGGDFPGSKCIRNNKDGTSTSGKCEDVCKDKTVYSPHPSEDPPGTTGICYEAARVRIGIGVAAGTLGSVSAVKLAP